ILVVLKKVADLTTNFFRHVVGCTQLAVSGVKLVDRNGQKLGVTAGLVFHLQHTQSTAGYDGTHLNRERRHHEDINGVTVIRQSLGDVAVVAWVMHGGQHESIDKHGTGVFIHLVFHRVCIHGDFDDDVEFVRQILARGYAV